MLKETSSGAVAASGISVDLDDDAVYDDPRMTREEDRLTARYTEGKLTKQFARYKKSLANVLPIRPGKSDATGASKIDDASLLSFVTYYWVFDYLLQAFRGRLSHDRVWNCSIFDASAVNMARLEYLWNAEVREKGEKNASLLRAVWRFTRTRILVACFVFLFCLVFGFIGPTCLVKGLVAFAERPPKNGEPIDYTYGLVLVISILVVEFARVLSYGGTWAVSYRTGIRVRGAVLALIFKRLVSGQTLKKTTAGEVVNMYAADGQRIFDAITFAPLVIVGPLVLVGGIIYLLVVIGPWSLLGILVFLIFDVFQYGLGMTMVRYRKSAVEKTEKRLSLMGEIIRCIRLIKMNAWEETFLKKIETMRHSEKVDIRTAGYAQSLAIASGPVVPAVAAIATFLGVVLSGNDLTASDAFSAITVFFVMLFGIRMIPYGSRYLSEAVVALKRFREILLVEKWPGLPPEPSDQNASIVFRNASFSWSSQVTPASTDNSSDPLNIKEPQFVLEDINLVVKKKELLGITGPVGSGKTALLTSVVGHLFERDRDQIMISGSVAWVPQLPWLQTGTIRENILFGKQLNPKRYYNVINAVQLGRDLEAMPANELSEVGERGTTLSGGQRARVGLARGLYSNADINLLDDVLAALDPSVADNVFEQAIVLGLANKTVLFVTSDPKRLARCDRVVFLDGGKIVDVGTHNELKSRCPAYVQHCTSAGIAAVGTNDSSPVHEFEKMDIELDERAVSPGVGDQVPLTRRPGRNQQAPRMIDDEEDLGMASVAWKVYKKYLEAAGGVAVWILVLFAFIFNVAASLFSTIWLARWLKNKETYSNTNGSTQSESDNGLAGNQHTSYYASIYAASFVILFISGLFKAIIFVKTSLNAASGLHNGMLRSIMRASVAFFNANPSGRILNRFSKDMDEIDVKLPFTVEVFLQNMITCIGFLLVISWVFPLFLLAAVPVALIFTVFVLCFRAGIRSLKRSEHISRSPLFDHITESMEGLVTIHTFGQTNRFMDNLKTKLDINSGGMFMFQSGMRWLAVWLDLLVVVITGVVSLLIVILTGRVSPADAGMALSFAIQMSGIFQFAVRTQTELEAKMTSVERVAAYCDNVESEGEWTARRDAQLPKDWPANGKIEFQNVKLRYRLNMPLALDGVTFTVESKQKIGIIGRTGAGKSSLGQVLYRMYELSYGKILIDGVEIATLGVHTLRRAMACIPQDPVLFAGTIRSNLDPITCYSDEQLWTALEKCFLKSRISELDLKLEAEVQESGRNFSVGERQLLCMARALLTNAKIILLDEATSSLDANTDQLIGKCVRESFKDATVLVIAHRFDSVADLDKILILDQGKVLDYDTPANIRRVIRTEATTKENSESPEIVSREDAPAGEVESDLEVVSEAKVESIHEDESQ